jgi:hypothetical protein
MTEARTPTCGPTHWHACECREAHFAALERDLAAANAQLQVYREALKQAERALSLAAGAVSMMQPCTADECKAEQAKWKDVAETKINVAQASAKAALAGTAEQPSRAELQAVLNELVAARDAFAPEPIGPYATSFSIEWPSRIDKAWAAARRLAQPSAEELKP